tara:strand:+ start:4139 stop:4519 length:381 start_codon:yes stop_codon:yes gene_type:complete
MANLQSLFNLTGTITGQSDAVSITVNPNLPVTDPSVTTAGLTTSASTNQEVLATTNPDSYFYARNTGLNGGGGSNGVIQINSVAGVTIALLKVGDWCFIPIKSGLGIKLKYQDNPTNVEYAYFARG